jgi:hypothetical protein
MSKRALVPEIRLVTACCRWPPSPARDEAVREAAAAITDWPRFLHVVRRHRVTGFVRASLSAAGVRLEIPIAFQLGRRADHLVARNAMLAAESAAFQQLFDAAGMPAMILKGAALARLAYGDAAIKEAQDIDLLILPDHAEAAIEMLEARGYQLISPVPEVAIGPAQRRALIQYRNEASMLHPVTGVPVDLHWALTDGPTFLPGVDASTPGQLVDIGVPDAPVRTLGGDDLFVYLAVHGALHSWGRIKWLADFQALVARQPPEEIDRLYRHAQRAGAGRCAGQGLLLSKRLLGLELPPGLAAELEGSPLMNRLANGALELMVGPDPVAEIPDRRFATTLYTLAQLRLSPDWRYRGALLANSMFLIDDVLRVPLPPSLSFLYPLLRLPLWMGRRVRQLGRSPVSPKAAPTRS